MKENELKRHLSRGNISVVEAMKLINANLGGIVFIVDEEDKLIGSVSDGDVRRWLIQTGDITANIEKVMFQNTRYIYENQRAQAKEFMREQKILVMPVVSPDRKVIDIIIDTAIKFWKNVDNCEALRDIPVIIMAGGKGTRLYPYTKILPKPLIPIGDIPILERILERFFHFGVREFYLTVNYKKEMLKSYFSEVAHDYLLHYVEEDIPLGTAGSIRLIEEKFQRPVIITNCDTLIEADYEEVIRHHEESKNDMTIISCLKNITIPYGVLHSQKQGIISSIEEKPQLSYFINTGMYIVNPEYLEWIPGDQVFHMTDLAEKMMSQGKRVGMYPIHESAFLDMGEFEELKKMEERINGGFTE